MQYSTKWSKILLTVHEMNHTWQEGDDVVQLQLTQSSLSLTVWHVDGHVTSRLQAPVTLHHIGCHYDVIAFIVSGKSMLHKQYK